jgi:tetratricopeptide (TPR) repeat protein
VEPDGTASPHSERAFRLQQLGRYDEARDVLREALAAGDLGRDRPRVLQQLGHLLMFSGEFADARQVLDEALTAAQEAGDGDGLLAAFGTLGQVMRRQEDYEGALRVARVGAKWAREWGKVRSESAFTDDESRALRMMGDIDGALAAGQRAAGIGDGNDDPIEVLRRSGRLANLLVEAGRVDEARAMADDGVARCRELSDLYGEASFLLTLGEIAELQDRSEDCYDIYVRSTHVMLEGNQWGLLAKTAELFALVLGPRPGGHRYYWLAARSTTATALLGGDEMQARSIQLAVHAMTAGAQAEVTHEGLDNVCELLRPDGAPEDYPEPPVALEAAVRVIVRWWFHQPPDENLPSAVDLDAYLGTGTALATLVSKPSPYTGGT